MNDDENEFFRRRHYAPPPEGQPRDRPPFHPLANHFPMMDPTSPEYRGLVGSIKAVGLTEPITLYEGAILDGRNRLLACEEAGVEPRFEVFDGTEQTPLSFVMSKNLYRRHLSEGQRALKAEEMITTTHGDTGRLFPKSANADLGNGTVTRTDAARQWCVNIAAVDRAAFVRSHALPDVVAKVAAGRMTLGRAAMLAKLTDEEQRQAPDILFAGRKPKPKPTARPVTVPAIRALTDEQFLAIVIKGLPRLNRAAAREGMVLTYLPLHQSHA